MASAPAPTGIGLAVAVMERHGLLWTPPAAGLHDFQKHGPHRPHILGQPFSARTGHTPGCPPAPTSPAQDLLGPTSLPGFPKPPPVILRAFYVQIAHFVTKKHPAFPLIRNSSPPIFPLTLFLFNCCVSAAASAACAAAHLVDRTISCSHILSNPGSFLVQKTGKRAHPQAKSPRPKRLASKHRSLHSSSIGCRFLPTAELSPSPISVCRRPDPYHHFQTPPSHPARNT